MDVMCWLAERANREERVKRKIAIVDGVEIDIDTGEVLGVEIEHERDAHMNAQAKRKRR